MQGVRDSAVYVAARQATAAALSGRGAWDEAAPRKSPAPSTAASYPDYMLGILIFAVTVVAYTTYGGFWAVTWTDVLQGLVIVVGAVLLMVFALVKVGGLTSATQQLQHIDPQTADGAGAG